MFASHLVDALLFKCRVKKHDPPLWVPQRCEWIVSQSFGFLAKQLTPRLEYWDDRWNRHWNQHWPANWSQNCQVLCCEDYPEADAVYVEMQIRELSGRERKHILYVHQPIDIFSETEQCDPGKIERARACLAREQRARHLALIYGRLWRQKIMMLRVRRKKAFCAWRRAQEKRAETQHHRNLAYDCVRQNLRKLLRTVAAKSIAREFICRIGTLADFRYRVGALVVQSVRRWRALVVRQRRRIQCAKVTCCIIWRNIQRQRRVSALVDKAVMFFQIYKRRKEFINVSIIVVTWLSVAMPVLDTISSTLAAKLFPLGASVASVVETIESARSFFTELYAQYSTQMTRLMPLIETYAIDAITRKVSISIKKPIKKHLKKLADKAEIVGLVGKWENLIIHLSTLAASFERLFFHYVETSPREQRVFAIARRMPSQTVTDRTMTLPECWALVLESLFARHPSWRPRLGMQEQIIQIMFLDTLKTTANESWQHSCGRCFTKRPWADCRKPLIEFVSQGHLQMFCQNCMTEPEYAHQPVLVAESLEMIFMDMIQMSSNSKSFFVVLPESFGPLAATTVQRQKSLPRKKKMKK